MACTYETYYNPLDSQKHCTLSHVNFAWWWIHPLQPRLCRKILKTVEGRDEIQHVLGPAWCKNIRKQSSFLCITGEMCVDLVAEHVHENFMATRFLMEFGAVERVEINLQWIWMFLWARELHVHSVMNWLKFIKMFLCSLGCLPIWKAISCY